MTNFEASPAPTNSGPWGDDTCQIVNTQTNEVVSYCHRKNVRKLLEALTARPVTLHEAATQLARAAIDSEGSNPSDLALSEAVDEYVQSTAQHLETSTLLAAARHLIATAVTTITFPDEDALDRHLDASPAS